MDNNDLSEDKEIKIKDEEDIGQKEEDETDVEKGLNMDSANNSNINLNSNDNEFNNKDNSNDNDEDEGEDLDEIEKEEDYKFSMLPFKDDDNLLTKDEEEEEEEEEEEYLESLPSPKIKEEKLDAIIKYLEDKVFPDAADFGNVQNLNEGGGGGEITQMNEKLIVLGPDHPKMQRFQKALKEHLLKQIKLAEEEVREMANESKTVKKERTSLGNQLYNLQYELTNQTESIKKIDEDLNRLEITRNEAERDTQEARENLEEIRCKLNDEINKEKELMKSVRELDMMEWCVRQAAEEFDGELVIRQLVDEKIQKLKKKAEVEKRDQDFYLDKVMSHVQRMEQANAGIGRQIEAHVEEQKELSRFISEAGTEIEALQIEKIHLNRAWNETVNVVKARDEALNAAREILKKTKEDIRNRESELASLQRSLVKEQESHEGTTILLKRRKMEERHLRKNLEKLENKGQQLENELALLFKVKLQLEEDLLKLNNLLARKQKEIVQPRRKLELLSAEKIKLEDEILTTIQEQTALDKASQHISAKVKVSREKTRLLEGEVAKVENEMTKLTIEVEKLKGILLQKTSNLEEMEKRIIFQEKVLQSQTNDIKQADRIILKKTSVLENLNKKLAKMIQSYGNLEIGPLEREINELEEQISAHKASVVELQDQWLQNQDSLVSLTTERDDILRQNDLIQKEIFVLERKKQRLNATFEDKNTEISKIKKSTEILRGEIAIANTKLQNEKASHVHIDKENIILQNELMGLLKEAEMEAIELEEEIRHLEEDRERLLILLREAHEQCLQWEKKIKIAKELKDSLKREEEGNTGQLKLAIHHMQVRYNELKRAQEKIMCDLERSIERRDRIIQQADMNLKKANIHPKKTKINIQRNYQKLKEKNRALAKEAKELENEVSETQEKVKSLQDKLACEEEALCKLRELVESSEMKINDASIQKHKNLIEIVLRQQKYKVLESIRNNRYKPLVSVKPTGNNGNETGVIEAEVKNYEQKCFTIIELCNFLLNEFPENELHIQLIKASILTN